MNLREVNLKSLELKEDVVTFDEIDSLARCSIISCQKYDGVSIFSGDATGILLSNQDLENIDVNQKNATVLVGTSSADDAGIYKLKLAGISGHGHGGGHANDIHSVQVIDKYIYVK